MVKSDSGSEMSDPTERYPSTIFEWSPSDLPVEYSASTINSDPSSGSKDTYVLLEMDRNKKKLLDDKDRRNNELKRLKLKQVHWQKMKKLGMLGGTIGLIVGVIGVICLFIFSPDTPFGSWPTYLFTLIILASLAALVGGGAVQSAIGHIKGGNV